MTNAKEALAALIARAETADPAHRIDLRDPIAAHGAEAIEAVAPWLKVPSLAAFAIRVIARAGLDGEREAAQAAIRAARRRMDSRLKADADWALGVLRAPSETPAPAKAAPRARAAAPAPRPSRVRARGLGAP